MSELPNGWLEVSLGDVAKIASGIGFPKQYQGKSTGDFGFFKVGDISRAVAEHSGQLRNAQHYVSHAVASKLKGKPVTLGSTVFAKIGEAIRLNRRAFVIVECLVDNNVMAVKAFLDESDRYLFWFLKTLDFTELSRATTVPSLRKGDIETILAPIAPLNEQKRIADKLDSILARVDACRERLDRVPAILKRFRQAVLAVACSGGLTEDWREKNPDIEVSSILLNMISSNELFASFNGIQTSDPLPELPEKWTFTPIEPILSTERKGLKTGPFGSMLKKSEHQIDGVPVLGIENIDSLRFKKESKIHITREKAEELSEYGALPGDILISRSGTVGEVCVVPENIGDAIISTNIIRVSISERFMLPIFFCFLFNGSSFVLNQVRDLCKGSTRDFLNQTILKSLIFPLPPIEEQREIVRRVEALFAYADRLEASYAAARAQVERLTPALLAKAFRGELVPQDPNDEPASVLLERIRAARAAAGEKPPPKARTQKKPLADLDMPLLTEAEAEAEIQDVRNEKQISEASGR